MDTIKRNMAVVDKKHGAALTAVSSNASVSSANAKKFCQCKDVEEILCQSVHARVYAQVRECLVRSLVSAAYIDFLSADKAARRVGRADGFDECFDKGRQGHVASDGFGRQRTFSKAQGQGDGSNSHSLCSSNLIIKQSVVGNEWRRHSQDDGGLVDFGSSLISTQNFLQLPTGIALALE